MSRQALKSAPYNPRIWPEENKRRLRNIIKENGLLEPITWNITTGNVVGGHLRLAIIDALEGNDNYLLDVSQVELTEAQEKAMNVAFNNPEAQGEWDLALLEPLLTDPNIDITATGFDAAQVIQMFGEGSVIDRQEELMELSEKLRGFHERMATNRTRIDAREDKEFYTVLVFRSNEDRKAFTNALGVESNRYIDGRYATAKLGAVSDMTSDAEAP